jgi:hypothetical protein
MVNIPSLLAIRRIEVGVMPRGIHPILFVGAKDRLRVFLPVAGVHGVSTDEFEETEFVFPSRAAWCG